MKTLVTGATGFVGSHIARCLIARGHVVRVLARSPQKAALVFPGGEVEVHAGDMTDASAVRAALADCDALVHAAAAVSLDPRDAARLLEANLEGTRSVIGSACDAGVQRILYVSSLSTILALPGADPGRDSPVRQSTNSYARAKAAAEREVRAHQDAGAPIAIVYPNGVIGPDDPGRSEAVRAFRGFLKTTLATGGGLASVDARDLALVCVRLLEEGMRGRFVLGGQFQSWDELVATLEPLLGRPIPRLRAPAWLLRGAGAALDLARRVRPISSLISREAMEYATRMRPIPNDPIVAELGVNLRPLAATYRDTLDWLAASRRPQRAEPSARPSGS